MVWSMESIQLWGYRCQRCGHEWVPRDKDAEVVRLPEVQNPYWDRPRKDAKKRGANGEDD